MMHLTLESVIQAREVSVATASFMSRKDRIVTYGVIHCQQREWNGQGKRNVSWSRC